MVLTIWTGRVMATDAIDGGTRIECAGYSGCILLENADTRVVLDPNCGGRVLEYSWKGRNSIMLDPEQDGWTYGPDKKQIDPCGGRLDIGPEMTIPKHPALWLGTWTGDRAGPRKARLTSQHDEATGVQLIRDFELSEASSHLRVTQTIQNVSHETKSYCHWSRTFVLGGGVCLVPLSNWSKFPRGFMMYDAESKLAYRMRDTETVKVRDNFFEISGIPPRQKFGIDSYAGWLGYITKNDLLMVKKFPTYINRAYGDISAFTVAIWYNKEEMCELEPVGPMETIRPGQSASFTEDWWLLNYEHPGKDGQVDLAAFSSFVEKNTQ